MTLCDLMNCSMPGILVLHYPLKFGQTHVHLISDAIQPPHPLDLNFSQHWVFWISQLFPVQLSSVAQSYLTLCDLMDCSTPESLSFINSWTFLKFKPTELVTPSNHLILCHPLLLLPSIFPSIRVFPNESNLCIRWTRRRRRWQRNPEESHGQRSLVGCCP